MPNSDCDGASILDFGCGPGHDLVGFGVWSKPSRLAGVDVSRASLAEASSRISLHTIAAELHHVDVQQRPLPFANSSFDLVHCSGVLHHMADPASALEEFRRVLKPGGQCRIMVYNRQSIWYHLYVPYVLQIEEGKFPGLTLDEAFQRSTDGPDCPIRGPIRAKNSSPWSNLSGSNCHGGVAVSAWEMVQLPKRHLALLDKRLPRESREFLVGLCLMTAVCPPTMGTTLALTGVMALRRFNLTSSLPSTARWGRLSSNGASAAIRTKRRRK